MAIFYIRGERKLRPGIYQRHENADYKRAPDPAPEPQIHYLITSDGRSLVTDKDKELVALEK